MAIGKTRTSVLSAMGLVLCAALLPVGGCAQHGDPLDAGEADGSRLGIARLSVQAAPTTAGDITRVTVTVLSGPEAELAHDPDGNFSGTLLLPEGSHQLVGNAFVGDQLVGTSAPVSVEIQGGAATQAVLRILDLAEAHDIEHSPIVLGLTYPLSTVVNQPAQLSISAVDLDDDALAVEWTSDCADGVFSAPTAFVTDFTKPAAGTCEVSVSVTDGELSASETFSIMIFEESQAQGAVIIDGRFIARPVMRLTLQWPDASCFVNSYLADGTCQEPITAPGRVELLLRVEWGDSSPGLVEVTDSCGGAITYTGLSYYHMYDWQPPTAQAACSITARSTNGDGLSGLLSAAVLVSPEQAE
ncbi:hypothetical protein BE21_39930 [Sorangium cellulosum]|uniref:PKD/Chitinase domain-containing protein n=1 Tax=Sorangium cellulosum TaxID=56 RepID=A0A150TLM6_SORCE|nr:hypothetical protein BE21_39930 [Sorangium cellulosum]